MEHILYSEKVDRKGKYRNKYEKNHEQLMKEFTYAQKHPPVHTVVRTTPQQKLSQNRTSTYTTALENQTSRNQVNKQMAGPTDAHGYGSLDDGFAHGSIDTDKQKDHE